jgi:hypothetical protein
MADAIPPIPAWLADRPSAGGLVVPWITPRTADGRFLFGGVDRTKMERALRERRCGVCGQPLGHPLVLMMRLSDLAAQCTVEPALHPQCAAYTIAACPMVAGRLSRYRNSPVPVDHTMVGNTDTPARLGAPAEPWFSVWLRDYHLTRVRDHLAASYRGTMPLRIRPINWLMHELF